MWLNPQADKIKQILRSDWLHELSRWAHLSRLGYTRVGPAKKKFSFWPFNKSFINEDCSVTVAGYLLCSFFSFLLTSTSSHKTPKRNLANI